MEKESKKSPDRCRSGTAIGYRVEYKIPDDEWKIIPLKPALPDSGVRQARWLQGIHAELGLLGYEAAMALAWHFKANAPTELSFVQVRVMPFRMEYRVAAYREDGREITLPPEYAQTEKEQEK